MLIKDTNASVKRALGCNEKLKNLEWQIRCGEWRVGSACLRQVLALPKSFGILDNGNVAVCLCGRAHLENLYIGHAHEVATGG